MKRHLNGFTLVELLVVIAIISILAALLMPALREAMEQAHIVHCQSNLKQIGLGIHSYASERGGMLPGGADGEGSIANWIYWTYPNAVGEDFENPGQPGKTPTGGGRIFLCPKQEEPDASHGQRLNHYRSSYAINCLIHYHNPEWMAKHNLAVVYRLSDVAHPESTLLVTDSGPKGYASYWYNPELTSYMGRGPFRHRQGGNVLFFDNHVTWREGIRISGLGWPDCKVNKPLYDPNQ